MTSSNHLTCPNCGASISNTKNCEHCGSLLVRFIDKNINLSEITSANNSCTSEKLLKVLKLDIETQKQTSEPVAVDLYKRTSDTKLEFICSVLQSGQFAFDDGTIIPSDNDKGLCVLFTFLGAQIKLIQQFKRSNCFHLFEEKRWIDDNGLDWVCFFADFGLDAEGTALILSNVLKNVQGVSDDNLECFLNSGIEAIVESRQKICGTSEQARGRLSLWLSSVGGSALFTAGGIWMLIDGDNIFTTFVSLLIIILFGGGMIFSIISLVSTKGKY